MKARMIDSAKFFAAMILVYAAGYLTNDLTADYQTDTPAMMMETGQ